MASKSRGKPDGRVDGLGATYLVRLMGGAVAGAFVASWSAHLPGLYRAILVFLGVGLGAQAAGIPLSPKGAWYLEDALEQAYISMILGIVGHGTIYLVKRCTGADVHPLWPAVAAHSVLLLFEKPRGWR